MDEPVKSSPQFQNVPPHDTEAEQAVLSSIFMDKDAASVAMENLRGDDFYNIDYRIIFEASEELYHSGIPIDVITVKNKLEEKNLFEQVGGIQALANIASAVGSSVNIRNYAKIVEEKSLLRRLIKMSSEISALSYSASEPVENIMEKAEKGIFDIMQNRHTDEFHHIREVAVSSFEKIEEVYVNQLTNRMLCSEAMMDAQKLRTGDLTDEDWETLISAMGPLSDAPIYIDDTPGISPMDLRAKCRRLKLEKGLGLIIIDYLQLMSGNGRNDSRQQEISDISRALKAVAREMEAPVIALSQLSRACEQRADHRPMLSDLRESGAIEQDADVVAFLYRDEYYFPDTEKKNQAELIIAKQRNGPTGTVELAWLGQYTKFSNILKKY